MSEDAKMLSITKLEHLLGKSGFVPIKYFVINHYCAYIEVISINSFVTFILAIPTKYKFKLRTSDSVFKLSHIKIDMDANTTESFAGAPDDIKVEKTYTEIQLTNILERAKENEEGNIAGYLEKGYNRPISIADVSKEDLKDIRNLVRQVRRLKYCVTGLGYKLVVMYKSYMCVLDRDDAVECFLVKGMDPCIARKMFVSVDLEFYYENVKRLVQDISDIEIGIVNVLNKNQNAHSRNISHMISSYTDISKHSDNAIAKKDQMSGYMNKFRQTLLTINKAEKNTIEKLYDLEESIGSGRNMTTDMEYSSRKSALEKELEKIHDLKRQTINKMCEIKEKRDNMALILDTVFFDGLVMMDRLMRNLEFIKNISMS